MAQNLTAGTGDTALAQARGKARVAYEQARARRERVRADLAEGRVIELSEARQQIVSLATNIRAQLDKAQAYLPSHLSPDERSACEKALSTAIVSALRELEKADHASDN